MRTGGFWRPKAQPSQTSGINADLLRDCKDAYAWFQSHGYSNGIDGDESPEVALVRQLKADISKSGGALKFPVAYNTFGPDERQAALDVLDSGRMTMGTRVAEFEDAFAKYLGVSDAVMVNSGSSADLVMMMAARETGILKPGDLMLLPAVTWPTQVWAAIEAGFRVRLVDVDVKTLNSSFDAFAAATDSEVKAWFPAHIMGNSSGVPVDTVNVTKWPANYTGEPLFTDCCESLGSVFHGHKAGSYGTASAFSFFFSHHISTIEGGMIATNSPDFADCCRQLRAHGWVRDLKNPPKTKGDSRYHFTGRGFNFRPTELQGAMGLVQLKKLDEMNTWRRRNRNFIFQNVRPEHMNSTLHIEADHYGSDPAWFAMPFVLKEDLPYSRDDVFAYLAARGIETRPLVGGNIARQPAFSGFRKFTAGTLDNADVIHDRGFYVGLPPFEMDLWPLVQALQSMHSILIAQHEAVTA